jgi:hypothetical protein
MLKSIYIFLSSTQTNLETMQDPSVIANLNEYFNRLQRYASSGDMETVVMLLPESSRESHAMYWPTRPNELRRRQGIEEVITGTEASPAVKAPASPPNHVNKVFAQPTERISTAVCFKTEDSCTTATGNCSGHGSCYNKYANRDGTSRGEGKDCYVCQCITETVKGTVTTWAGATCSKVDVSSGFWIFVIFTVLMVGIVSMSVGMLFSVGEEKLPGVIGAGVSKSK